MLPGTIMYVYLGSVMQSLAALGDQKEKTTAEQLLFWAGLVATIIVAVFVGRVAKKAMARAASGTADGEGPGSEA